jgi:hypothetical protein
MPRVVDPNHKIIFCEGRPGSLDDLLLGHILPLGQVLVKPVGGKHGMRAFIEGYLGAYSDTNQPDYLGFRDRDFDVEPPEQPQLTRWPGEKPIWLSYRAAVENYSIDAHLIHRYWAERENAPGWSYGPAPSLRVIEEKIQVSAQALADYQAVRWALAQLKPGARWPELPTTWTGGSGTVPDSLHYADCLTNAHQLVTSFQDNIRDVQTDRLSHYAETYRQKFSTVDFFEEEKYLIWFHGKDHLAQLCRCLAPNFPRRHYADWAAEHLDVRKHPDLLQLIKLARQNIEARV